MTCRSLTLPSLLAAALACLAACASDPVATVAPNPNSALSVLVGFTIPGASSARVVSTRIDGGETLATPSLPVDASGTGRIAVLGLAPQTSYRHVVEATVDGEVKRTVPVVATTGALPAAIAGYAMQMKPGTGAPPGGYLLVSGATTAAFAVDASGAIRWYRLFDGENGETKQQPDGTFTAFVGATMGWQPVPGLYVRFASDGSELARYAAATPDDSEDGAPPVYTDDHELLVTRDAGGADHLHLFGYEIRPVDESTMGAWHEILRQSPGGAVEFRWKSWSRFAADDETETIPLPLAVDVDHANALTIDPSDGNYVASFRDLDAIVKVDASSGAVLWQLGGKQATLTTDGDPLGGFQGQHSVRVLPNGHLLLFDNGIGHTPPESRAVEYALDLAQQRATMVWQYRHTPALFTAIVGTAQRLANGDTLVGFVHLGVVDEVAPDGSVVWEGQLVNGGQPTGGYRIERLPSLYAWQQP